MTDPRIDKLADILVNYSIDVRKGDTVVVFAHVLALPLYHATLQRVILAGGLPLQMLDTDETAEIKFKHMTQDQLEWISPIEAYSTEKADAGIFIEATSNTRAMNNIDPRQQQLYQAARTDLFNTYMQRSASGEYRWVLTQFPCAAYAQEADMSLREYENFVYGATFADQDNPVAAWQEIHDMQQRLVDWLAGKKEVVVKGPHIDLTLSIEGRTFDNADGRYNMPSGEIFTGPVEDSVNGWVNFTYPAITSGREVDGVSFEFKDGKVLKATAKKNEEFLLSQLDSDKGARYLGEFAIGTNYGIQQFTKSILYDEKIGGTIHMAVGSGYPETGSKNVSSIHWDFICDMREESEIYVDGVLFYKDGQFQV